MTATPEIGVLARAPSIVASDGYAVPIKDATVLWLGRGQIGDVHVPIVRHPEADLAERSGA